METIIQRESTVVKWGSSLIVNCTAWLAATSLRQGLTKLPFILMRSLIVGALSSLCLASLLTAQDVSNDGSENGFWVNSSISTLEWSGVAMMSPLVAVTQQLIVAVYPVEENDQLMDDFPVPLTFRASKAGSRRVAG